MNFLYMLEKIRVTGFNELMLFITNFGSQLIFILLCLTVFWCINKKMAYYILTVGFLGTIFNQFMKLWFRIPRPWVLDKNFSIVEQARQGASGYSFPSGHSQNAVGTFGCLASTVKNKWLKVFCIAIMILVPFSRMYLGVHTPLDVITASAIALILVFALKPVIYRNEKSILILLVVISCASGGFLLFTRRYSFPEDIDIENLNSGIQNAYTLFGAALGLLISYIVDDRWLHFQTRAVWWAQILKVTGGIFIAAIVSLFFKNPLCVMLGELPGRSARYFLIVISIGVLWPMTFRWFSMLGYRR